MLRCNQLDYLRKRIRLEDGLAVNASTQDGREAHAALALDFRQKLRMVMTRKSFV